MNAPSQQETTLQCNVVSHWLGAFTKWSLIKSQMTEVTVNAKKWKINFSEIGMKMKGFSFKRMHFKSCLQNVSRLVLGFNMLKISARKPGMAGQSTGQMATEKPRPGDTQRGSAKLLRVCRKRLHNCPLPYKEFSGLFLWWVRFDSQQSNICVEEWMEGWF